MSNTLKFTEAFISDSGQLITLDKIKMLSEREQAQLKGTLRCPECHVAILTIVHSGKGNIFFRTVSSSSHHEQCSSKVTSEQKTKTNKFCEDAANRDFVRSQLETLKRLKLFNCEAIRTEVEQANAFEHTKKKTPIRNTNSHSLFRKSLNRELNDCDYDICKLFYGNVKFVFQLKETWGFLRCYDAKKKNLVCSIKLTEQVYKHMDPITAAKIHEKKSEYKIFFAAIMERKGAYNNCTLIHSSFMMID